MLTGYQDTGFPELLVQLDRCKAQVPVAAAQRIGLTAGSAGTELTPRAAIVLQTEPQGAYAPGR